MKKICFVTTEDWFFLSHFASRAKAAAENGFEVHVICRMGSVPAKDWPAKITPHHWEITRKSINPFSQLQSLIRLFRLMVAVQPDILHLITLQAIILGGFAARMAGIKKRVNAVVGLGYIFVSGALLARILRPFTKLLLRLTLKTNGSFVILENEEDLEYLVLRGLARRQRAAVIPGAGVDLLHYHPPSEPRDKDEPFTVLMASRLLLDKGIYTFLNTAKLAEKQGRDWRFLLAGGRDAHNPSSIAKSELEAFRAQINFRLLGQRKDVPDLMRAADVFTLPTAYGEGLPKVILEAMASGLPVVASDVPGCRSAIVEGETGLLIPPSDPEALFEALDKLANDRNLRIKMGAKGLQRVKTSFADDIIFAQTLKIWQKVLEEA